MIRQLSLLLGTAAVITVLSLAAHAAPVPENLSFAVMRNGEKIGTTTLNVERNGAQTVAHVTTYVEVKLAFITVYRFAQTWTEHWNGDRLVALQYRTDDNGKVENVAARNDGNALAVEANGRQSRLDPATIPANPWNPLIVRARMALDPQDGTLTPVSALDHGENQVMVNGRPTLAHHYSIRTSFSQDVWYDRNSRPVRAEMRGRDGSTISVELSR